MIKKIIFIFGFWIMAVGPALPASNTDTSSSLLNLKEKIEPLLRKVDQTVKCQVDYSLQCEYQTRDFMIHDTGKGDEYSDETRRRRGPKNNGLMLNISLRNKNEFVQWGKSVYPYWKSFLQAYYFKSKPDLYLKLYLGFNDGTDRNVMEAIKQIVSGYALAN